MKKVFYITGSRKILNKITCRRFRSRFLEKVENIKSFFKNNIKTSKKEKIPNIADLQSRKSRKFQKNSMSLHSMVII